MEIYQKNIAALEKYRGKLYRKMKETTVNLDEKVFVETARDESKIIRIERNEKNYYLNSKYAPKKEAVTWTEKYEINNIQQITIIFGLANGMFLQALLEKIPSGNRVIVYEPSLEIFKNVLENIDITKIIEHRSVQLLIQGVNEKELYSVIAGTANVSNWTNQKCLVLPRYAEIFAKEYEEFLKQVKSAEENAYVLQLTAIGLAKTSMYNSIKNMKYIMESKSFESAAKTLPENMTAILVSAGPSLAEEIDVLKQAKGKALIVAVERILDVLIENDIVPDILVSIDPVKEISRSKNIANTNMVLLTISACNPKMLEGHNGKKIVCNNGSIYQSICRELDVSQRIMSGAGSVATFAFSALLELGVKRIVLVGQDLAFRNGKSHAGETQEEDPWNMKIEEEGVNGETVITRQDWKMFAREFESKIAADPEREYIDTKRQGLKLKGTKSMPLKKVLEEYCSDKIDIKSWLDNLEDVFELGKRKNVIGVLENFLQGLQEIKDISKEAVELCEKIKKAPSDKDVYIRKLQKSTEELENKHAMVLIADILYGQTNESQAKVANLATEEVWNDSKELFRITINVAKEMEKKIKKEISELNSYFGV